MLLKIFFYYFWIFLKIHHDTELQVLFINPSNIYAWIPVTKSHLEREDLTPDRCLRW